MDMTFLIQVIYTILGVSIFCGIVYFLNKTPNIKEIVDELVTKAPEISEYVYKMLEAFAPKYAPNEEVKHLVTQAVDAVEQISKSTELTSEEKKDKAIEYYYLLAEQVGAEKLTSVQQEVIEILIEAAVKAMDNGLKKLDKKEITSPEKE